MSARKRLKLKVGDVFSVPLDCDQVGYGQIAASWGNSGSHFYFAIFDGIYPASDEPDLDAMTESPLVLLALSMDALLFHDHWKIVGHRAVNEAQIPWPAYKEGVSPPGAYDIVDAEGKRRRRASDDEVDRLRFRKVVAPIRVEKALRAFHGQEPWDADYDELRPVAEDETSAELLG